MSENDGKFIFGMCRVSDKGQIVIPKKARDVFNISPGDNLLMLGDIEKGIALMKVDVLQDFANDILTKKGE